MQLGILVTRAAAIDTTWTTLHLARAALERGHTVRFIETRDLQIDDRGRLVARCFSFDPPAHSAARLAHALARHESTRRYIRIDSLDLVMWRASPFDAGLGALAMMISDLGIPIVNHPLAMMRVHHKGWLATLQDVPSPTSLITTSSAEAQLFYDKHRRPVVLKPARGSGGHGVQLIKRYEPASLYRAFAQIRQYGHHVVVQTYVPQAEQGEKRVLWLDGQVIGAYLRTAAPGDFRHNLKQGGTASSTQLTASDIHAIDKLSPHLRRVGLRLAGIDVLAGHIIEVNAVNPGGSYHIDRLNQSDVSGQIIDTLVTHPLSPSHVLPWSAPSSLPILTAGSTHTVT